MMNLVKVIFEFCGIFAFAMAFYFLGKNKGIQESCDMCASLMNSITDAVVATMKKEGEDDANQGPVSE